MAYPWCVTPQAGTAYQKCRPSCITRCLCIGVVLSCTSEDVLFNIFSSVRSSLTSCPFVLQAQSTMGTVPLATVREAAGKDLLMFFQLYVIRDRDFTRTLIQSACLMA